MHNKDIEQKFQITKIYNGIYIQLFTSRNIRKEE